VVSGTIRQAGVRPAAAAALPHGPDDAQLQALARSRPDLAWHFGADISIARNAHNTNTRMELAEALQGEFDWFEADVRLGEGGVPVLRHKLKDAFDLELQHWLQIVAPTGRGIKLDVKEPEALPAVIEAVRRTGVPQYRLIMNVYPGPTEQLLAVRRAFPRAIINVSPVSDTDLTPADIVELQVTARLLGGAIMFPIRHDLISREVVQALRPFGRIAVWNTPELTNPSPWTPLELRLMGVDGMIDLRESVTRRDRLSTTLVSVGAKLFGWNAVYDVLDAVGLL
jgi:hypothetical protein